MMMINDTKHTRNLQCKFNNTGYCKFGEKCRRRHFTRICQEFNCNQDCQGRHPRLCRMEESCRFFKNGNCAYKHVSPTNDNDIIKDVENLKSEIVELKKVLEQKQKQINKIASEKKELLGQLDNEKCNIKKLIEDLKQSNSSALDAKDSEIVILKEQIRCQQQEINKLKINSKEENIIKDIDENEKEGGDFNCDKCIFSTSDLSTLVKHKANEHKPFMVCDKCGFKSLKRSEFQVHQVFAH